MNKGINGRVSVKRETPDRFLNSESAFPSFVPCVKSTRGNYCAKIEVFITLVLKIAVSWDGILRRWVYIYRRRSIVVSSCSGPCSPRSFDTAGSLYTRTRNDIPEDVNVLGKLSLCLQTAQITPHHRLKADSHIACRAHAVPLPFRVAKCLECVFPI